MPLYFPWEDLPYLLASPIIVGWSLRNLGPKTRAWMLEDLSRWSISRLTLIAMFWLADKAFCWWPNMGAWDERLDERAASERSVPAAPGSGSEPDRHVCAMWLERRESGIYAECRSCKRCALVRPPRRALSSVDEMDAWLERLERRLVADSV